MGQARVRRVLRGREDGAPRSLKADFWGDSDWRLFEGDRDAMVGGIPLIHEDRECPRWGALVESLEPRVSGRAISSGRSGARTSAWATSSTPRIVRADGSIRGSWRWTATGQGPLQRLVFQMGLVGRPQGRSIQPHFPTRTTGAGSKVGDALEMRGPGEKALWYKGFVKEVDGSRVLVSSHTPNVDRQWLRRCRSHL